MNALKGRAPQTGPEIVWITYANNILSKMHLDSLNKYSGNQ